MTLRIATTIRAGLIGAILGWIVAIVDPFILWYATGWMKRWSAPPDLLAREGLAWLGSAALVVAVAVALVARPAGRRRRDVSLVAVGLGAGLLYAYQPAWLRGLDVGIRWLPVGVALGLAGAAALVLLARLTARVPQRRLPALLSAVLAIQTAWWIAHPRAVDRADFPAEATLGANADETGRRPDLLLVVLDTVRADHLASYGAPRRTTPVIDRFAERATVFTDCMSPAPWTLPAHASMFTGLPATTHGCNGLRQALDARWTTLAEHLRDAGYQTIGISANPYLDAARGFDQGFDLWRNPVTGPTSGRRPLVRILREALGRPDRADDAHATAVNRRLAHWFAHERDPDRPWFVFVNHIEAHAPYDPPSAALRFADEATRSRWRGRNQHDLLQTEALTRRKTLSKDEVAELQDLYDDEIAFVDAKVGELLEHLDRSGALENTCVVITSDHGEQFGEHGLFDHLYSVDEPLLHVPLIVRWPSQAQGRRDERPRQTHDLFATLTKLAGVEGARPPGSDARDLRDSVPLDRERLAALQTPLISNVATWAARMPDTDYRRFLRDRHALRKDKWKLSAAEGEASRLYDLASDPSELHDRATSRPDSVEALESRLRALREVLESFRLPPDPAAPAGEIDPTQLERLRALGYVE